MVSIVQPQRRRTEAAAAARSIVAADGGESRMDLSGARGELPIPMHTTASPYGGSMTMDLHGHHNGQSQAAQGMPSSPPAAVSEESSGKKRSAGALVVAGAAGPAVKYRECLKNHAAAIGGNATDGCGEFMPSGEEGSLEALKCSACGCHRNFHRKELDDLHGDSCATRGYGHGHRVGRRLLGPAMPQQHHKSMGGLLVTADHYGSGAYAAPRALPPPPGHPHHQIIMPLSMIHTAESDEIDGSGGMGDALGSGGAGGSSSSQKRFRTKFSPEQKARMLDFAERVGWRLQKLDDAMVNQFCQEIGVKRRVLKVWMHNNKHSLAKRPLPTSPPPQQHQQQPHAPMPVAMQSPPPMPMPVPMPMAVHPSQQQQQQHPGPSFHRDASSPQRLNPE
ncbi:zinc-finger homeodomain protein 4-like isoform X1 [Lolium rigidum]|uniref:zinc-finger homeodomain protein 4-like isoform X1 n=2 Tax=Lolium rigidum TaxID=89674 RepID=UPI001F5D9D9E|nr:zinc-finger homeodomain protein 4-like isoform X1 [Lolium rigidum]